jgi:sugar/nucleoside kinase (ribokinase family)
MTLCGLFVGLATLDVVHTVAAPVGPNEKAVASRQEVAAGGPAANAAVTFAALGGRATLVTALGRHPLARAAAEELVSCGVDVLDVTPDASGSPPVSLVRVIEASGLRSVTSVNDAAADPADLSDPSELDWPSVDVVLVDGHHPRLALAAARAATAPVMLDGGSWKPVCDEVLPYVDGAICSSDFALPGDESTVDGLLARGVPSVAVTHGADPIEWATREERGLIAVPQVPARDTLGAGDAFHGAAALALAQGQGWPDTLAFAARVAAVRVQHPGPRAWRSALGRL